MEYVVLAGYFLTYSQSSGAIGSLVSRLARLTLKEVKGRLSTGYDKCNDKVPNAHFPVWTYISSLGSGEANVSGLASRSSWAGRSTAAVLSSRTLEEKTGSTAGSHVTEVADWEQWECLTPEVKFVNFRITHTRSLLSWGSRVSRASRETLWKIISQSLRCIYCH